MIYDTTLLIDLYREARKGEDGPATRFLLAHPDDPAQISIITFAEFAEGFTLDQKQRCADILKAYSVLEITEPVAWCYADVSRKLRENGARIDDNDLWIAATALAHKQDLVTRNLSHFRRVEGLRLRSY